MKDDAALAAALRALPAATPPHDGWGPLAARIGRRRRTGRSLRVALPAALAAAVTVAVALPHLWPVHQASPTPRVAQRATLPPHAHDVDPDALSVQSRRLQAWVDALERNGPPLGGDALDGAVALQDRIGLLDLQLSTATDAATRASLWRQRNVLLQQLGLLHLQPYAVAEHAQAAPNATTML